MEDHNGPRISDFFGWPTPPVEQRMITEIPGIDRPGANLFCVGGLGNIDLPKDG
ncbi:MAG: hypothetical protein IPO08_19570 [Xanthomonadales bacterium]|nr:hypothetical protein [Xanthomonadales bacterium]